MTGLGEFTHVVDEHAPAVYRYVARRAGPDAAEDLTAEVFCAAFAGSATFDPARGSPIAWLMGIATHILVRHWRSEERQLDAVARLGVDPLRTVEVDSPEHQVAAGEETRAVARVLAELPETDREALLLFAWADLPYAEVAAALDVPVGTVRSRISRARQRLRAALDIHPTDEGADHG